MWVSITYSFSSCYCFIFLLSSELSCSDLFLHEKYRILLQKYSIRNQRIPSVYIRKKTQKCLLNGIKISATQLKTAGTLPGILHPSTVLSVCIHLPQTSSSFEYLNFFSNPFKWTAWKSEHILAIWRAFLHTRKSKYQIILAQNPVVQREIPAPLLEKHGL